MYENITNGRESLTIEHAVALARIAVHGPPPAIADSAKFAEAAMKNFKPKLGERFCTLLWKPGFFKTKYATQCSYQKNACGAFHNKI